MSTFRGEGELSNLQLDENVLTDLLELPMWLRLTSAWCNHVLFRISWTKLKSVPITLTLDEVNITVETCEFGRTESGVAGLQSLSASQGKYSFIHKVIDGITVIVNTVNVNFKSPAFTASVQVSNFIHGFGNNCLKIGNNHIYLCIISITDVTHTSGIENAKMVNW